MKLVIILALLLPVALTQPIDLVGEYDILKQLPMDEVKEVIQDHLRNDPQFQAAINYFHSPEWIELVLKVRTEPHWMAFKRFLKDAGINLDYYLNHLEHCFNYTNNGFEPKPEHFNDHGDLKQFILDLGRILTIPFYKFMAAINANEKNKVKLQEMFQTISSNESRALFEGAIRQAPMVEMKEKLKEMGMNLDGILFFMYHTMNWMAETTTSTVLML